MKDQKKMDQFKNEEKIGILETDENKPKLEGIGLGTEPIQEGEEEKENDGATSISDINPLESTSDAGKVKKITISS